MDFEEIYTANFKDILGYITFRVKNEAAAQNYNKIIWLYRRASKQILN